MRNIQNIKTININSILAVILLTAVWAALCENITVYTVGTGLAAGVFCVWFCNKYLPVNIFTGFNILRLAAYPFYLVWHIYISGFAAIKLILTDAEAEIIKVETKLTNKLLQVILANSITLTPGTVSLDLNGSILTVLRLRKKDPADTGNPRKQIGGSFEKMLLKIQKG